MLMQYCLSDAYLFAYLNKKTPSLMHLCTYATGTRQLKGIGCFWLKWCYQKNTEKAFQWLKEHRESTGADNMHYVNFLKMQSVVNKALTRNSKKRDNYFNITGYLSHLGRFSRCFSTPLSRFGLYMKLFSRFYFRGV